MLEARHGPMEARRLPGDGDSGARARAGRCQAARKARSHTRVRAHDPQPRTHTRPYAGACTGACSLARAQTGRHACARTHAGAPARKRTRAQVPARQAALQLRRVRRQTNKQTNKHPNASRHANEPPERASDGANNRCFRRYEPVGNRNGGYWGRPGFCAGQPLPAGLSQARRSACTRSARTGARSAAVPLSTPTVSQYFHSIPVLPRNPHSTPTVTPQGPVQ